MAQFFNNILGRSLSQDDSLEQNDNSTPGDSRVKKAPSESPTTSAEISAIEPELAAVSVKLPEFWKKLPNAWFHSIEAQFALRGITVEKTQYEHLLTKIDESMAMKVMGVMENPGATPYTTMKNALIKAFTLTDEQKMKELLRDADLGDRKPSEFFNYMKSIAGNTEMYSETFLLALWEERLPNHVAAILKIGNHTTNEKLVVADSIFDALRNTQAIHSVNSTHNQASTSVSTPTLQALLAQNQKLEQEIEALKYSFNRQRRPRSNSRFREKSSDRKTNGSNSRSSLCFYHQKFKERANKCQPPCSFGESNSKK